VPLVAAGRHRTAPEATVCQLCSHLEPGIQRPTDQAIERAIDLLIRACLLACLCCRDQTANKLSYGQLWVRLPLVDAASDPWEWWNALRTMCEYQSHIHPVLQFTSDLPSEADLARWLAEPLKAVIIPTHVFLTNRAGFPALSRRHQQFLNKLFSVRSCR